MDWDALERNYKPAKLGGQPAKKKGFWLDQISTAGGMGGAFGGAALGTAIAPGVGTLVGALLGGALGSGAGEFGENVITGEQDKFKNVGAEALTGGIFSAGPLRLAKAGMSAARGGAKAATEATTGGIASRAQGAVQNIGTNAVLKVTPSQRMAAQEVGVDVNELAARRIPELTANIPRSADMYEALLGKAGKNGKGGIIQQRIGEEEGIIKSTVAAAGRNTRLDASSILRELRKERNALKGSLGNQNKIAALDLLIKDAEKKYANGVTATQALSTLREANSNFGKTILDDTTDAIAKSAQKIEANSLRSVLKARFPDLGAALDSQSDYIQLRGMLNSARAKAASSAFKLGKFDLTRPGTLVDGMLNNPRVGASMLRMGSGVPGTGARPLTPTRAAIGAGVGGTALSLLEQAITPSGDPSADFGTTGVEAMEPTPDMGIGMPQGGGLEETILALAQEDLVTTGGKNLSAIKAYGDIVTKFGGSAAQPKLTAMQKQSLGKVNTAEAILDRFESLLGDRERSDVGPLARVQGVAANVGAFTGLDQGAKVYNDLRQGLMSQLAKSLGESGAMAEGDIRRALALVPALGETPQESSAKIAELRALLSSMRQGISSAAGGSSPTLEDMLMQSQPTGY